MRDDIFDYLISLGFTASDLRQFEKTNSEIFYVVLKDVKDNIDFLFNKGLSKDEIKNIINNNPFMLTDEKNRREYYDNLYLNVLKFNKEELINFIKGNNDAYTSSPIEFEKIINYLSSHYNKNEIKQIVLKVSKIVSMKLDDFKKIVKLV